MVTERIFTEIVRKPVAGLHTKFGVKKFKTMPFRESEIGGKVGKEETPKDKDIEAIKKEIKEKYPEFLELIEEEMQTARYHTENEKKKYPVFEDLIKYAQDAEIEEVLISPYTTKGEGLAISTFFNCILIKERCLPIFEKLKDFAPDFLDKALKHTFGNIKEEIPGHEKEHTKDLALKIYLKRLKTVIKQRKAFVEDRMHEVVKLKEEEEKLKKPEEFYAMLQTISKQRILKHPERKERVKEVVDANALHAVLELLLRLGIEQGLEIKLDKENNVKHISESPSKEEGVKGLYPYLKKEMIDDIFDRFEEIRKDLKEKYEEKYGKIEKGEGR